MSGLQLTLNIQQDEYLPNNTYKAGARVVVHSQDDFPFPESKGFDISPGEATGIGVSKVTNVPNYCICSIVYANLIFANTASFTCSPYICKYHNINFRVHITKSTLTKCFPSKHNIVFYVLQMSISRMGGKYGTCVDTSQFNSAKNVYEETYNWTKYTQQVRM